ncbi:hypothetical protein [Sporosarcina sp. FSL K6-1508]|uniref:hypothetical protein n=1 Tax=Sporosarcina sp. FSL K6-1508 TaxID=2921553 RepID=UPI0030FBD983
MMPANERLDAHDKRLQQHSDRLQQLEMWDKDKHKRLKLVEVDNEQQERRLNEVEQNYTKLENTILTENRETRNFFQTTMDKQWQLITLRDSQKHEVTMSKQELAKTKFERWSDIILKLVGAGGIIYILLQSFVN